jgi:hypothetical protein
MDARPLLFLLLISIVLAVWRWRACPPSGVPQGVGRRWRWHPRTPDDCPLCRDVARDREPGVTSAPSVRPWAEVKSRRGAPKRRPTQGYACPRPTCGYYGVTDERLHALVAYGAHGQRERIPDLRCQACGTKFSVRRGSVWFSFIMTPRFPPHRVPFSQRGEEEEVQREEEEVRQGNLTGPQMGLVGRFGAPGSGEGPRSLSHCHAAGM